MSKLVLVTFGVVLTLSVIGRAQGPEEWRPNIAEDNKAASWDDTAEFIRGSVAKMKPPIAVRSGTYADWGSGLTKVSTAHCGLTWSQRSYWLDLSPSPFAGWSTLLEETAYQLDFSKVDPLTISVKRDASGQFTIALSGANEGAVLTEHTAKWKAKGKGADARNSPLCHGTSNCREDDARSSSASLGSFDFETSHRVARALLHAALLCGGTKAVSPF